MSSNTKFEEDLEETPRFIQPLQSIVAFERGTACFEAVIAGSPAPDVRWYHRNTDVTSSLNYEVAYGNDGKVTLLISEVLAKDAGEFTCEAVNELGQASSTAELVVQDEHQSEQNNAEALVAGLHSSHCNAPGFIRTPPRVMKLVEGGSIRLEYAISGTPPVLVTWARNGTMLKNGYRFKITEDKESNLYSLIIRMLFADDVGEYTTTATNQSGFISESVMLISEEDYRRTKQLEASDRQLVEQDENENNNATMDSQDNVPQYNWRNSLKTRDESTNLHQHSAPDYLIDKPENEFPRISQKLKKVSHSPVRNTSSTKRLEEEGLDIERFFKPKFLKIPDSLECNEGQVARIDCKVTGRPLPDVTFMHNGSTVYGDLNHRVVVKEDGLHSFIISPARPGDSGEYTIFARSQAGEAAITLHLFVIPQEGLEHPRIVEKPQSISVMEGDLVRLEVFAVGKPTPEIVWLKDNLLLIPEKLSDMTIEGIDGHGLLTIKNASKIQHDAWYTATAVNKTGRDLTRCKVTVKCEEVKAEPKKKLYIPKSNRGIPETYKEREELRKLDNFDEADLYDSNVMQKPRFKKKLVSKKQKILGSVHFENRVVPIGDPTIKVEWLLDGKPLECANRITEVFEFGYAALDISSVYPRDTGVISCRATNAHGQTQTSCTLIVKEERGLVDSTQLNDRTQLENIKITEKHRQEISLAHDSHLDDIEQEKAPPKVLLPLDPVCVQEGEPARFRCHIVGHPLPKVEWYLNNQAIHPSKRFRIWYDGIHYFEITAVRGYDHGEVRFVAENEFGNEEIRTTIEVFQGQDMRSVLHKSAKASAGSSNATKEKGKHMVPLREVEKPIAGVNKNKKVERDEELQSKFSKLAEEERILHTYDADKKKSVQRDKEYESYIRDKKDHLVHRPRTKQIFKEETFRAGENP